MKDHEQKRLPKLHLGKRSLIAIKARRYFSIPKHLDTLASGFEYLDIMAETWEPKN